MFAIGTILGIFWLIIVPGLAIGAWVRTNRLDREILGLKKQLQTADFAAVADQPPEHTAEEFAEQTLAENAPAEDVSFEEPAAPPIPSIIPATTGTAPQPAAQMGFENKLTSRWLVWLGAVTIAMGSVFLVKYSIDQGLLGPAVRVSLGVVFGIGIIAAGEWLRRKPLQKAIASIQPDYIPTALSGAGVVAIYASIFSAQALHGLIPPFWGFVFLAFVSIAAVGLSLLQGPFIAVLGIVGGFLVPLLIPSDHPSAAGLLSYVFLITATGLGIIRYKDWHWLAWITLAGALIWPLFWMMHFGGKVDSAALSIYLPAILVGFYVLNPSPGKNEQVDFLATFDLPIIPHHLLLLMAAAIGVSFCGFVLSNLVSESTIVMAAIAAMIALFMFAAYHEAKLNALLGLAVLLVMGVLFTWDMPIFVEVRPDLVLGAIRTGLQPGPLIPPQLVAFVSASLSFSVLLGLGAFLGSRRAQHPGFWTAISAALPLLVLINAYGKILRFDAHIGWATASLALAGIYVLAASAILRKKSGTDTAAEIASYAVGAVAAIALALTMSLREAWLSVAIALMIPAIAQIYQQLKVPALRHVASILAGIVIARLALNPNVLDYTIGDIPGLNWMLYAYGVPAIAFYWSAKKFRQDKDDRVVGILEAGSLIFAVLLVSLEIRHFVNDGPIDGAGYSLFEKSLQSLAWLAGAYGLYKQDPARAGFVRLWGWRVLAGLAAVQIMVLQLLLDNPMVTGASVWSTPIVNLLLFAYALPAVFAGLFFFQARRRQDLFVMKASGGAALLLTFITLTLEIRQLFHGEFLTRELTSNGEWYAYSVAWLAYAACLLALGFWKHSKELRYASLVLVLLTVSKVFLWDMAELEGLFRVGSFFALGGCLIGIGFVYQRFLLRLQPVAAPNQVDIEAE